MAESLYMTNRTRPKLCQEAGKCRLQEDAVSDGTGKERIDLRGFAGIDGFGDLSAGNIAQVGLDTVVNLGAAAGGAGGPAVLNLTSFIAADLDQTDFVFA
ncbi:MAG: hypothetical protein AB7I59_12420 [Geminicoccaceae bacterium]